MEGWDEQFPNTVQFSFSVCHYSVANVGLTGVKAGGLDQQQQLWQKASSITLHLASVRIAKCPACNSSQQLLLRSRIVFQIKFVVRGTGFLVCLPCHTHTSLTSAGYAKWPQCNSSGTDSIQTLRSNMYCGTIVHERLPQQYSMSQVSGMPSRQQRRLSIHKYYTAAGHK